MKTFWKLVFSTTIIFSQTGIEIARMFDAKKTPRDMSNVSNMILTNSKGKSRVNKMVSRSLDGNKKQIIWFLEPKDDKGVAFLKIEHENKDDDIWNFFSGHSYITWDFIVNNPKCNEY